LTSDLCEGCGLKQAQYGLASEDKKRWCAGCGKAKGRGGADWEVGDTTAVRGLWPHAAELRTGSRVGGGGHQGKRWCAGICAPGAGERPGGRGRCGAGCVLLTDCLRDVGQAAAPLLMDA
jgi:hypothetical protein